MDCKSILEIISAQYNELLGENLTGIYVHGSIAFGCFNWDRSDIDFIVVIKNPVSQKTKLQLLRVLEDLREYAVPKGFEMSVVLERYCKKFVYPTPYELHFSIDCLEQYLENPILLCDDDCKTDYDLAAHFTVIANFGVVLCGLPISEVFGAVPRENYVDSILKDIENAKSDVLDYPVYIILNLCRVYAYVRDGLVLSKMQGGRWGLDNLPKQYYNLIACALSNYARGTEFLKDEAVQIGFCEYMLKLLFE